MNIILLAGCTMSGDERQPESEDRVDAKGEIEISIDGASIDLSEDRFQADHADNSSRAFHLHESDDYWYMEGEERITFAEPIDLRPYFRYSTRTEIKLSRSMDRLR